jgi:hypothetical protein
MVGDSAVFASNIASGQINGNNIASGAILSTNIGSGAITSGAIASGQIGEFHLGSGCVRSGSIASGQFAGVHLASGVFVSGIIASGVISWVNIAAGGLLSGNIGSGQIGSVHIADGAITATNIGSGQIDSIHITQTTVAAQASRIITTNFNAGELISGIKAVCMGSGGVILAAQAGSGLRLPAIGVTMSGALSGTACTVVSYGRIFNTASGMISSGFDGTLLYTGSGGYVVSRSGFTNAGGTLQAPFLSGDMQQSIGISVSGGMFVMPNLCVIRSGFANSLPYDV